MLKIVAVARRLGVSRWTVLRLIELKQIRATKIGSRWRISEADLVAYLEANANVPAQGGAA